MRQLRSPALPVGIFLTATLCLVLCRDKRLAGLAQPLLQPAGRWLHIGTDSLYLLLTLFVLPLLFLVLARENPKHYGLSLGKMRLAVPIFLLFLVFFTAVGLLVGKTGSFRAFYGPAPDGPAGSFLLFLTYLLSMTGWEFMNRGFLMLGLKKYVGVYAVYIQLLPFVLLHLGKPPFELYGSVLFGLLFGFYAYLVNSFIYGAVAHAWFALVIRLGAGTS
ncbi:MAG: CPBP family intramembrane glutamic endopeptidase [bacterium]